MTRCRHLLGQHWIVALTVVMVALLARIAIPTGYMPMIDKGQLVFVLCAEQNAAMPGASVMPAMPHMDVASPATGHSDDHQTPGHDQNGSCGFGGLSLASLAAIDPIVLALAIAFILAAAFRRSRIARVAAPDFLWPPRTGPPARA